MNTKSKATIGRRQFLRALGAGAAVTGAVTVATQTKADTETNDEKHKARYKESEHVGAYYRVNRYPS
jgi:hypothetical protein